MVTSSTTDALQGRARSAVVMLALSLLAVELVAGMQTYLSQTVLPLAAEDLDGSRLYGVVNAAADAALFLTLPLGGALLARYRIGPLMLALTLVTVMGATVCALSTSMPTFITGTVIRSLAGGALATVSMGAISQGLPPRHRQLVLAGMAGTWVISSLVGPAYAASVSSVLGWRWAMVLYLPVLFAARMMIARYMPPRQQHDDAEKVPFGWAVVLALGAVVLSVPLGAWSVVAIVVGGALMLRAARSLLPAGALAGRSGRPAALSALLVTTAVFFGAADVLAVVSHDAFGLDAAQFGFVIAAPSFVWAVVGLWCGSHPGAGAAFRRRALLGGGATTVGVVALLITTMLVGPGREALWGLAISAAVLGLGMGLVYPDLLGRCFTEPQGGDGISDDHMAASVVMAEAVGTTLVTTVAFTWLGTGFGQVAAADHRAQLLYAALLVLTPLMVLQLARSARGVTVTT